MEMIIAMPIEIFYSEQNFVIYMYRYSDCFGKKLNVKILEKN